VKAPDLFGPQRLYRRLYDRTSEVRDGKSILRHGYLHTLPPEGEDVNGLLVHNVVCALPYCQWGPGRALVPAVLPTEEHNKKGGMLPPGWRRSHVQRMDGGVISWEPTEPTGEPVQYEAVDVKVSGIRKEGRDGGGPPRRFTLQEHGFTWVRQGEAGPLDDHRWFTSAGVGETLAGELRDWRAELWDAGLRELLASRIGEELGATIVEITPLIDDLKKRRALYDAVYRGFLASPLAAEHGIVGLADHRRYILDRDLDLTTSSCDERDGRITANNFIPTVLELGPARPPSIENLKDFNRRPPRPGLVPSHRAAAWPVHIDLVAEGPTSHLMRASEVGDVVPNNNEEDTASTQNCTDEEALPCGAPLRREMMQCWVLRDESITCMPLMLFHDDGDGPEAFVPELDRRDIVIWRTGHALHGALSAVAHGEHTFEIDRWESLGATLDLGGVLRRVDAGGRAEAEGLRPGDVLAGVDGRPVEAGRAAASLLAACARRQAADGVASSAAMRLTFSLPRFNGRRSVEFRFFVYWAA